MDDLNEVITNNQVISDGYIVRNGFVFTTISYPHNVFDSILIKYPTNVPCSSPLVKGSSRSLQEQIDFINEHKIEKALIIADNIEFITLCPSLTQLYIIPADNAGNDFDYSPLYKMPQIKGLQCRTRYGANEEFSTCIDYSKIKGIEDIDITDSKQINYNNIKTLKSLGLSAYKNADLADAFSSTILDTLFIIQCKIKTLEGIQKTKKLQCLYLYYNRSLHDISALRKVSKTLKALRIEACPKIDDFSVLGELENLELLELSGSNNLPDLSFIKQMKNLKTFTFSMNVLDGDLTPCLNLSYVYSEKNHKHYNLKDADLPKGEYIRGNEDIEEWRRLE